MLLLLSRSTAVTQLVFVCLQGSLDVFFVLNLPQSEADTVSPGSRYLLSVPSPSQVVSLGLVSILDLPSGRDSLFFPVPFFQLQCVLIIGLRIWYSSAIGLRFCLFGFL